MMKKFIYSVLTALTLISCGEESTDDYQPKIYFKNEGVIEIGIDEEIELYPKIVYDDEKTSKYIWTLDGEVISDKLKYNFTPEKMKDYTLSFEVHNKYGSDTSIVNIIVRELLDFTEIDNVTTKSKAKELIMHADEIEDYCIKVKEHRFLNNYIADTLFWGGFAYSSRTDIQNLATEQSIGCAFVTQGTTSAPYLVATNINGEPYIEFKEKYIAKSIDIANDNYCTVLSKFGIENVISEFKKGNYLKVRIYGVTDNASKALTSNYVEHTLIDCDFDGPAMYFRQNSWETLNLRELGMVEGLYIDLVSNVEDFPLLCCIDNIKLQKE